MGLTPEKLKANIEGRIVELEKCEEEGKLITDKVKKRLVEDPQYQKYQAQIAEIKKLQHQIKLDIEDELEDDVFELDKVKEEKQMLKQILSSDLLVWSKETDVLTIEMKDHTLRKIEIKASIKKTKQQELPMSYNRETKRFEAAVA